MTSMQLLQSHDNQMIGVCTLLIITIWHDAAFYNRMIWGPACGDLRELHWVEIGLGQMDPQYLVHM